MSIRRNYPTITALRSGKEVYLGNRKFRMKKDENNQEWELRRGDMYIAERNGGPQLLFVQQINIESGFIIPTTLNYCYDIRECVAVEEVD